MQCYRSGLKIIFSISKASTVFSSKIVYKVHTAEQIPDGERWGCAVDNSQLLYPDCSWLISGVGVAFV
jgi:hypothetical protein